MSSVYATTDYGERVLVRTECDRCPATIRPSPDISESGWMLAGTYRPGTSDSVRFDYCPVCWEIVGPDWEVKAENTRSKLEKSDWNGKPE